MNQHDLTTVAFLGPSGTYSHMAAQQYFDHEFVALPTSAISDVFHKVSAGEANYGIVPIENSTTGFIPATFDCLQETSLKLCGESLLAIHHCLLSKSPDSINKIYAHQQSLQQCKTWLKTHYPKAEKVAVASNALGAQLAQQELNTAAIAGKFCAELYDLNCTHENIQDRARNTTRFIVIANEQSPVTGHDKTSLLIHIDNKPKALVEVVLCLADFNINITMIETRPQQQQLWDYLFYLDIEGHQQDSTVQQALSKMSKIVTKCQVLGSYAKASSS